MSGYRSKHGSQSIEKNQRSQRNTLTITNARTAKDGLVTVGSFRVGEKRADLACIDRSMLVRDQVLQRAQQDPARF